MIKYYKFKCPHCNCSQLCMEKVYTRTEVYAANDVMLKDENGEGKEYHVITGDQISGEAEIDSEEVYFCYNCLHEFSTPELKPELFTTEIEQDAY